MTNRTWAMLTNIHRRDQNSIVGIRAETLAKDLTHELGCSASLCQQCSPQLHRVVGGWVGRHVGQRLVGEDANCSRHVL